MRVNKIANYINNHKTAQNILKGINDNPAVFNAVSAFALASIARPALIGTIPFKDKKDKHYSQASALAAGTVELGSTAAIFFPLNKSIRKASDNLYKSSDPLFKENAAVLRQFKSITNRGIKVLALIPISLARFALVKPMVNLFFGGKRNEGK